MARNIKDIKKKFNIIGNDPALNKAVETACIIAQYDDLPVLVLGENGTGKEVFYKIIHACSKRSSKTPFAINCSAEPAGLIHSNFFGHKKGSYTDASEDREGYFSQYSNSTIFLDEIGDMPLPMQAMLLRVLETGEYVPMGSNETKITHARIVAATNVDLEQAIRKGRFRRDLYERIKGITIKIPPLRERKSDIPELFNEFALHYQEKFQTEDPVVLDEAAEKILINYSWPGNVRDLKTLVQNLTTLSPERVITPKILADFGNFDESNMPATMKSDAYNENFDANAMFTLIGKISARIAELENKVQYLTEMVNPAGAPIASAPKQLPPADNNKHTLNLVDAGDYVEVDENPQQ